MSHRLLSVIGRRIIRLLGVSLRGTGEKMWKTITNYLSQKQKINNSKGSVMQESIYNEIENIFDEYASFVVAIKGSWGSGKTYFWNTFQENELSDKQYAYISLFGKESIEDIKRDTILQISIKDKYLSTVKDKVSNVKSTLGFKDDDASFGMSGALAGTIMSLFEKKDFENVVICFDDFERISDKLNIKDILGYLSVLKEQYNCKIVLILNEEKISNDKAVYDEYKEKIVDFEFLFSPSVEECFKIVKPNIKSLEDEVFAYCDRVNLNNIRVIQRNIRLLNRIVQEINWNDLHENTRWNLVSKVFSLSTVYYKFGFLDFNKLREYYSNRQFKDEHNKSPINNDYEAILSHMTDVGSLYHADSLDTSIIEYLESSLIDIEQINNELLLLDDRHDIESIKNDFFNLESSFVYNLQADSEQYINLRYKQLETHSSILFEVTSFDNIKFYIDQLIILDKKNEVKYQDLFKKIAYQFIDEVMGKNDDSYLDLNDFYGVHIFEHFKKEFPTIDEYIDKKLSGKQKKQYDCDKLISVIEYIEEHRSWGEEQTTFLNSMSEDEYRHCLNQNGVLNEIVDFLKRNSSITSFEIAIEKIWTVLNELEKINENANAYKIQRIKRIVGYKEKVITK